jgi:L-lactate dehydrogenase complex protein LldG
MLARIREHLAASAGINHKVSAPPSTIQPAAKEPATENLVELFHHALEGVNGHCIVVKDEAEAAANLKQLLEHYQARRIAVSDSPLVQRLVPQSAGGAETLVNAAPSELFDCDAGITSAQWAIAETGTLVLESQRERHRLVSLVPPVHLAVVEAGRIRRTMAEVLAAVNQPGELSRAVTFITGPSRTSDIELTLAIGVHGPGQLHVIVIEDVI